MLRTITILLSWALIGMTVRGAVVTTGIPISQLPTTNQVTDASWFVVNQNRLGKLTNDTFKVAKSNVFAGFVGSIETNVYNTIYVTNLYVTNIVLNGTMLTNYWELQGTTLYPLYGTNVVIPGVLDVGGDPADHSVFTNFVDFLAGIQIGTNTITASGTTPDLPLWNGVAWPGASINPTDGAMPYRVDASTFSDSPWRLWWNGAEWDTNRLFFNTNLFVRDGITITAVGRQAGEAWISGGVTAFGQKAATEATIANGITAIGDSALSEITIGFGETALGNGALEHSQGFYDTAGGLGALGSMVNGEGNTAFGFQSGYTVSDGQYNTFLGYRADTALGTITNGIAIGMNTVVTNSGEIVIGNTGNSKLIVPIPTWTGVGDKALTDDGTYKTFVSTPGTTINPTDNYIPFRTNATTFLNSPWYVVSTNVATDSQIIFGPGTTNVLYRNGANLVYTNSSTSPKLNVVNSAGYIAQFGPNPAGGAQVTADTSKQVVLTVTGASGNIIYDGSKLSPDVSNTKDLGYINLPWANIYGRNTLYWQGMSDDGINYSRLAISHTGTNGVVLFDSQSAGTAGSPREYNFRIGNTNSLRLFATNWRDSMVPATAVRNGATAPTTGAFGPSGVITQTMFQNNRDDEVTFAVQINHDWKQGTAIYPHVHWTETETTTAGTNTVWELTYTWASVNGAFPTDSTLTTTNAVTGTNWVHKIASFSSIDGTGKTASSMLACRLRRLASSATADDYDKNVAFLGFDVHYQADSIGSDNESTKTP